VDDVHGAGVLCEETDLMRGGEDDMRGALRSAMVGVAVLTQACAGGIMDGAPDTAGVQSAPSYGIYGTDSYFKVEWQPDERRGKPIVSGYVTNQ
jgi:hypothetical protein